MYRIGPNLWLGSVFEFFGVDYVDSFGGIRKLFKRLKLFMPLSLQRHLRLFVGQCWII